MGLPMNTSDVKWHKPFSWYGVIQQVYREYGRPFRLTPMQYYGDMIRVIAGRIGASMGLAPGDVVPVKQHASTGAVECLAELVWYEFSRPVWFVDRQMLELLETAKIDDDLSGIHWPHESLYLCFEEGSKLDGFDLRSIMVFVPRSDLVLRIGKKAVQSDYFKTEFLGKLIGTWTDCMPGPLYTIRQDGYIRSRDRLYNWRKYTEPSKPFCDQVTAEEAAANQKAIKIAAAAMLYYSARPELVRDYQLPRSQRYEFRGDRTGFRRMLLPGVKTVRAPSALADVHGTGSPKRPHYRGWVMRVLRDPRYKRNEDGSFKTVLVPPTAIHPELMGNE